MDPDLKAKWVAALRSGEYRQGRGFLKYQNKYGELRHCCLGVLCELMGMESEADRDTCRYTFVYWGDASDEWALPLTLIARLPPDLIDDQDKLIAMNDADNTFSVIADWIEEHL